MHQQLKWFPVSSVLLLVISFLFTNETARADLDLDLPRVVVDSGGPYRCTGSVIQRFTGVIEIPGEYIFQPLQMVCTNGSLKAPGYSWVRMIQIPDSTDQDYPQGGADSRSMAEPIGRMIVNEDSFLNSAQIFLDLSRQLRPGRNDFMIEAAGRLGSEFTWEIRSIGKPNLYMPDQIATIGGAWLSISGSGFSSRPNENTVQIGQSSLPVGESNFSQLQVFIPRDFPAGNYDLSVLIRNYRSRVIKIEIMKPKQN